MDHVNTAARTGFTQRIERGGNIVIDYSFITELDSDELKQEAYRELGKTDLFFLSKYVLNYDLEEQTDIHYRFCSIADENRPRQIMLMFRGSYKTSLGIAQVIQWLIQDPASQIGVGSDKIERAIERVMDIRRILETNSLLKELYPEVFYADPARESDLWTQADLNIKRPMDRIVGFAKPSVSAFGLFPLPTGSHFTKVLLDDLENEGNVNTPELIQQLNVRVSSFMPLLQADASVLLLGTIYCADGPNTIYQRIWPTYKVPVVDNQGLPTFPSKYPLSVIEQYKTDINDAYVWSGQYLLRPALRTDRFTFPFKTVSLNTFEEFLS
jgi:hypothetical protein